MPPLVLILVIIGGIIVTFILIGFLLPRNVQMSRSIEIDADSAKIFAQVNNMKNFVNNWSPWTEKDPNAKHEYSGATEGVGAKYNWVGDRKKVGTGSMEILESTPNSYVKAALNFGRQGTAFADYTLEDVNGKTKVTWGFDGDMGTNPIARYFGLMMDKFLGPDYENGLKKLKTYCEQN
jgi:carbon monoxide dehydrogenase subunit G